MVGEALTGIYMEGDVILSRGERMLRGSKAFYDFVTNRAVILDVVFRTIQEQRNIPIYIRAEEARTLSARETWFRNAKVSTNEFYSPTYHVGAREAYLMDNTPYDDAGEQIGEQSFQSRMTHTTFNVRGLPILYTPWMASDFTYGDTALRRVQVGNDGRFGFGVETEWNLFRMLGLVRPDGFRGRFEANWYERGPLVGPRLKYERSDYSGYAMLFGMMDQDQEDDFGDERKNIETTRSRGRFLHRHKHFLPKNWQVQTEVSYLCDANFLEQFFGGEFWGGKEQETLVYIKKQEDNWAFSSLLKYRLNRFDTQTESFPELAGHLIGQPLLNGAITYHGEARAGMKRATGPPTRWTRRVSTPVRRSSPGSTRDNRPNCPSGSSP